jgi:predicted Zn-ribbon and HTH transcriptional regulator
LFVLTVLQVIRKINKRVEKMQVFYFCPDCGKGFTELKEVDNCPNCQSNKIVCTGGAYDRDEK